MEFNIVPIVEKKWALKGLWDGGLFSPVSSPSGSGYCLSPIQQDVSAVATLPMSLNQQAHGIKHGRDHSDSNSPWPHAVRIYLQE